MPKVSIVMPVLNGEEFIARSIECVINQTYTDLELIIVDSHSTDKTADIVKRYCARYDFIHYYLTDAQLTLSGNTNAGFSYAKGEYWTRLSCDDIFLPHALERLVACLDAEPNIGLVHASGFFINAEDQVIGDFDICPSDHLIYENRMGICFLYRAAIAKKAGGFSEKYLYCEDYEYWLRLNQFAPFKSIYERLFQYRVHNKSLSARFRKIVIKNSIQLQKAYYPYYIHSRRQAALFYAHIRSMDIYNPWRHAYLIPLFFYSPGVFFDVVFRKFIPDN